MDWPTRDEIAWFADLEHEPINPVVDIGYRRRALTAAARARYDERRERHRQDMERARFYRMARQHEENVRKAQAAKAELATPTLRGWVELDRWKRRMFPHLYRRFEE